MLGQAAATAPNAQTTQMTAVFWIETVEEVILVRPLNVGQPFAVKATTERSRSARADILRHTAV